MQSQIFTIEGCNYDLDDHKINGGSALATLARMAYNMNFAASTGSTSFSGGVMNAGMSELENPLVEEEINKPIGRSDNYGTYGYIAFWNSAGNHSIVKITESGDVTIVFQNEILDFEEDGDVDIKEVGDDIYLTDNHSDPKIIEPSLPYSEPVIEQWMTSQIRRQGAFPPIVGQDGIGPIIDPLGYTLNDISDDYDNLFKKSAGTQFAYYYIYNNYQESRLSPVSNVAFNTENLVIQLPVYEYETYLMDMPYVRSVVFCYRRGNTGTWNVLKRVENIVGNRILSGQGNFFQGPPTSGFTIGTTIETANFLPSEVVPDNIVNLQQDDVPLLAATNSIAVNRLYYGNYVIGYPQWSDLTLSLTITKKTNIDFLLFPDTINAAEEQLTFRPAGRYPVGVELLDFAGRRIGVIAAQVAQIPDYELWHQLLSYLTDGLPTDLNVAFGENNVYWYRDAENNRYQIDWQLNGTLPSWCASYRIVRGKEQVASTFVRSVVRLYTWYEKVAANPDSVEGDEGDVMFEYAQDLPTTRLVIKDDDGIGPVVNYYFKGYAMALTMGEPIQFSTDSNLFVKIIGSADAMVGNPLEGYGQEFQIVKQEGGFLFFNYQGNIGDTTNLYSLGNDDPLGRQYSAFFDVEFIFKRNNPDIFYWQTGYGSIKLASEFSGTDSGTIQGDCYYTKYAKINQVYPIQKLYAWTLFGLDAYLFSGFGAYVRGGAFSMNPIDLYNQDAQSNIGQFNIVNETQRQERLETNILESDPVLLGSQINGLNKFDSISTELMPLDNGPIVGLITTGAAQKEPGVMLAIGTLGWESIYVNATQITNADGTITTNPNLNASTKTLASHRPLLGRFGVSRLRDITKTPFSTVYAWSNMVNDVVRYAQNGLELLGRNFGFGNILRTELSDSNVVFIVYDQILDEVIVQGDDSNAFIFSERKKLWQGRREYSANIESVLTFPKIGISFSQNQVYVLDAKFWQTQPDSLSNVFFGEQKAMRLDLVLNNLPNKIKNWYKVQIMGPGPAPTNTLLSMNVEGENNLPDTKYIEDKIELCQYAVFTGNDTTTGGGVRGKKMESRIGYLNIQWPEVQIDKLEIIEISFNLPEVQAKKSA